MLSDDEQDEINEEESISLRIKAFADDHFDGDIQQARTQLVGSAIDEKGLAWLVERKVAQKLNIVFDIDHTLIFAFDTRMSTNLPPGSTLDTKLLKLGYGHDMTLVIRQGVDEMLEFLSQFCNLFAYSHGQKDYVLKILDLVDP